MLEIGRAVRRYFCHLLKLPLRARSPTLSGMKVGVSVHSQHSGCLPLQPTKIMVSQDKGDYLGDVPLPQRR